jgi:hypothetical protein
MKKRALSLCGLLAVAIVTMVWVFDKRPAAKVEVHGWENGMLWISVENNLRRPVTACLINDDGTALLCERSRTAEISSVAVVPASARRELYGSFVVMPGDSNRAALYVAPFTPSEMDEAALKWAGAPKVFRNWVLKRYDIRQPRYRHEITLPPFDGIQRGVDQGDVR